MSTVNMMCPTCRGELYADRKSVADMDERGYRGGRIICAQGCTSIWLYERRAVAERVEVPERRPARTFRCERCQRFTTTRASNTLRCGYCRDFMKRYRARICSQRHALKQKAQRRALAVS
jgi:hypothetical protein